MGDYVTLTLETPNGVATISMDAQGWERLVEAGGTHTLLLLLRLKVVADAARTEVGEIRWK